MCSTFILGGLIETTLLFLDNIEVLAETVPISTMIRYIIQPTDIL